MRTLNIIVLVFTLFVATYFDARYRKIPNKLTVLAIMVGITFGAIFNRFDGVLFALGGLFTGLAVFIIPFSMGGMGAGDVKLMAAVGSLMGWKLTVYSALSTAIIGGIIVLGYTIYKGYFLSLLRNIGVLIYKNILFFTYLSTHSEKIMAKYKKIISVNSTLEKAYIPYGVAITTGTLIVLIGNYLGYPPFS